MTVSDDTYVGHQDDHLRTKIHEVARRLRDKADEVDQIARRTAGYYGTEAFHSAQVSRVVHLVAWNNANLNLDTLVQMAGELDLLICKHKNGIPL